MVGTEPIGTGGRTLIRAEVPEIEVTRYAIDLRSLTHASGTFARHYLRHEPMPTSLAAKLATWTPERAEPSARQGDCAGPPTYPPR